MPTINKLLLQHDVTDHTKARENRNPKIQAWPIHMRSVCYTKKVRSHHLLLILRFNSPAEYVLSLAEQILCIKFNLSKYVSFSKLKISFSGVFYYLANKHLFMRRSKTEDKTRCVSPHPHCAFVLRFQLSQVATNS